MKVVCTELGSRKGRDKPGQTRTPLGRLTHDQNKMLSTANSRERGKGKSRVKKEKRKEELGTKAEQDARFKWSLCGDFPKMAQKVKFPQSILANSNNTSVGDILTSWYVWTPFVLKSGKQAPSPVLFYRGDQGSAA